MRRKENTDLAENRIGILSQSFCEQYSSDFITDLGAAVQRKKGWIWEEGGKMEGGDG